MTTCVQSFDIGCASVYVSDQMLQKYYDAKDNS
jgi:hypothetical protein